MSRARTPAPDPALERALGELAAFVVYPEPPDVAAAVGARLRAPEGRALRGRGRRVGWGPGIRIGAAVAAAAVAALLFVVAVPSARRAVADWLGIAGVRIRTDVPAPSPGLVGTDLMLGSAMMRPEAERIAGFEVRAPNPDLVGEPVSWYVVRDPAGARVSVVYPASASLPESSETGVGLLLMQFEATFDTQLMAKIASDPGIRIEPATVDGARGYWISGDPHFLYYLAPDGEVINDSIRLAGNTLLWDVGGISYRLESALSKERAVDIAESLTP